MASAASSLRVAFDKANVARVAIVDDGYDPPLPGDLVEASWNALRAAIDETDSHGIHAQVLAATGELPPYGDVRASLASQLYDHALTSDAAGERAPGADSIADALHQLFGPFAGQKAAKRRQLSFVEEIAREASGQDPDRLPSRTAAAELVGYDLIFLDFFLGEETRGGVAADDLLAAARAHARTMVRETAQAIGAGRMPLIVLISSRADPDTAPGFRDEAEMLASKFRFLEKGEFEADRAKTEFTLVGLVMERDAADAVERLLQQWKTSLHDSIGDLMASVRRLDVTDYSYLQKYRLAEEKVSLLEYLTWLFNSYLGSFVESRLSRSDAALVEPIVNAPVPSAMLQPMSEIPRIYSAVTTTQVKSFADAKPALISTGDLFVRRHLIQPANEAVPAEIDLGTEAAHDAIIHECAPLPAEDDATPLATGIEADAIASPEGEATSAEKAKESIADAPQVVQPDILAAVTPICDLIPGREKAPSVLLMGGSLTLPGRAKAASSHLLSIEKPGATSGENDLAFQIDWEKKWPVAYPRGMFDGEGILGTDYVRVGRLRDLYAADLAQQLSGDLARVGLPIAPPTTHPLHVRVLVRAGGRVMRLIEATPEEPLAWELYSKKSGEKREATLAVDLIWKLRAAAMAIVADPSDACRIILDSPETLRPLTTGFAIKDKATPTTAGEKLIVIREPAPPEHDRIQQGDAVVLVHLSGSHADSI